MLVCRVARNISPRSEVARLEKRMKFSLPMQTAQSNLVMRKDFSSLPAWVYAGGSLF
jgi:hypothetical protein